MINIEEKIPVRNVLICHDAAGSEYFAVGNQIESIEYEFGSNKTKSIPRNRRQDEVREDGIIVGREEWQVKVYDREEWKKLLRTARNHRILHMPMEGMNE
jgi:hypothetical protein